MTIFEWLFSQLLKQMNTDILRRIVMTAWVLKNRVITNSTK